MLTPAMSASRTSVPCTIFANAVSMQVLLPPFLKMWPFPEAITAGWTLFFVITVGPCPKAGLAAAAARPAVLVTTNSRRGDRAGIGAGPYGCGFRAGPGVGE